jgi:hypothetical protein
MLLVLWHVSPLLLRVHGEQVDGNMITSSRSETTWFHWRLAQAAAGVR